VLIVECWSDCYPYRVMTQSALQDQLLQLYGAGGSGRLRDEDVHTISFGDLDAWLTAPDDPANAATADAVTGAQWILFAMSEYNPDARPVSGAVRRFLDATPIDLRNKYLIAFSFNAPYYLDSTEISKLSAYFAVYSKTDASIEAAFRALFGDVTPGGHSPVNVNGIFYNIAEVTQPDPSQTIPLAVFGQDAGAVPDEGAIGLVAGPVVDRNGNRVADGTLVSFTLTKDGEPATASASTIDGLAGVQIDTGGAGDYVAGATVAGVEPASLAVTVVGDGTPDPIVNPAPDAGEGGFNMPLLALAVGVPVAVAVMGGAAGLVLYRRGRGRENDQDVAPILEPEPTAPAAMHIDADTRRVYVKGIEAKPPLSNEQFRLLHYLYERADKVISREELIAHVWPDAHSEGVSEEALDALVRRVRERIVQAGGERTYIVTLRGQGFRLEI
jgi:hypothetical protein